MLTVSYFFGVAGAVIMLSAIVVMLLRRRLRERHALWWLILGVLALAAALFPALLEGTARIFGITMPVSLVFFSGIVALFLVNMQHASELTKLEEQTRVLAESHALLELRVRGCEDRCNQPRPAPPSFQNNESAAISDQPDLRHK